MDLRGLWQAVANCYQPIPVLRDKCIWMSFNIVLYFFENIAGQWVNMIEPGKSVKFDHQSK